MSLNTLVINLYTKKNEEKILRGSDRLEFRSQVVERND